MRYVEATCLIILTASFVYLLGEGGLAVRDFRVHTIPQLTQAATDLDRSAIILGATATNIEKGTRQWQNQELALSQQATLAVKQLNADLAIADTLLSTANSTLISQSNSFSSLEQEATKSVANIGDIPQRIQPILANLSISTAELSDTLREASPEVLSTTQQLNETSKQLAATAQDGREVADAYKQKLLHPVRSFWHDVKTVFDITVEAFEAHAYFP